MDISNINSLKVSAAENKKHNTASSSLSAAIKTADKSSLEALDAMCRASIHLSGVSFKGAAAPKTEMANEEFKKLKKEFEEKFKSMQKDVQYNFKLDYINKCNINLALKILDNPDLCSNELVMKQAAGIIEYSYTPERLKTAEKILSNPDFFDNELIIKNAWFIISNSDTPERQKFTEKILCNPDLCRNKLVMDNAGEIIRCLTRRVNPDCIPDLLIKTETLKNKMIKNPDLYVNGEFYANDDAVRVIDSFICENLPQILLAVSVFDKETLNTMMRMRLDAAEEYITTFSLLKTEEIELVSKMAESCNIDGKPFMPQSKIEFIDLVNAYKENRLDLTEMQKMAESGRIDTAKLNLDLFKCILKNSGFTDEEISQVPPEKMMSWDLKYIHLLAKEINESKDEAFNDLFRAVNLGDFESYINDTSNIYGAANSETKKMFETQGMNYQAWVKPSASNNVQFKSKDKNTEQLSQIVKQLLEDIEILRNTGAKAFIDKQFKQNIKDDKFTVPYKAEKNKAELEKFIQNVQTKLEKVFERAEKNNNTDVITIKDHLNQRIEDVKAVSKTKTSKTLDLTIKMWDRNPQKDIFQGNYSTCCIAMGGGNGSAMPHYLMNTAYNMIELKDNNTGKIIGNALCYFITDENNKPAFVIDNIEIKNSSKPSSEIGLELRNAITQYAANVSKEVTGKDDTPIYMSSHYNDVPCIDLPAAEQNIRFTGNIDCDEIYMDLYDGWIEKDKLSNRKNILKLNYQSKLICFQKIINNIFCRFLRI